MGWPSEFRALIQDPETQLDLTLDFAVIGGVVGLIRVCLEPLDRAGFVTATQVHGLSLGKVEDHVLASVVSAFHARRRRAEHGEPPPEFRETSDPALGNTLLMWADKYGFIERLPAGDGPVSRRGRPVRDEDLRRVAEIVKGNPYDPRTEIRRQLNVSPRTASRWIAEAKKRGFIKDNSDKKGKAQ